VLGERDRKFLEELGLRYTAQSESGMLCLVLHDFELPAGYVPSRVDLLVRLPPGFPDAAPDMWWMLPFVRLATGGTPPGTELHEAHLGRTWQRWSRHFSPGVWRAGTDSLQSFLRLIRTDLEKGVS
jgi:hypothetical protein